MDSDIAPAATPPSNDSTEQPDPERNEDTQPSRHEQSCCPTPSVLLVKDNDGEPSTVDAGGPPATMGSDEHELGGNIKEAITQLSEVRASLETIGDGLNELAATVNDLVGLSDGSDSDTSDTPFSWVRFRAGAVRRRKERQRRQRVANARPMETSRGDERESSGYPKTLAGIRYCNFEQFKSHPADEHKLCCVDVLLAGDHLEEDMHDLMSKFRPPLRPDVGLRRLSEGPKRAESSESKAGSEK